MLMAYKIMKDLNKSDKSKYKRYWDGLKLAWRLVAMLDMDFPCMFDKARSSKLIADRCFPSSFSAWRGDFHFDTLLPGLGHKPWRIDKRYPWRYQRDIKGISRAILFPGPHQSRSVNQRLCREIISFTTFAYPLNIPPPSLNHPPPSWTILDHHFAAQAFEWCCIRSRCQLP